MVAAQRMALMCLLGLFCMQSMLCRPAAGAVIWWPCCHGGRTSKVAQPSIQHRQLTSNTWAWVHADYAHGKKVGFETGGPLKQQQTTMNSIEDEVTDMGEQKSGQADSKLPATKTWSWAHSAFAHGKKVGFETGGPLKQEQTAMNSIEDEVVDMGKQKSGQAERKLLGAQGVLTRPGKIARKLLATNTWAWQNADYAHGKNVGFETGGPLTQQQAAMDSIADQVADMSEQKSEQADRKLLATKTSWGWEHAKYAHGGNVAFETGGPLTQQQAAMNSIEDEVADMGEQKSEQADRKLLSAHRGSSDHQASRHHMHMDRRMGSDSGATLQQTDATDFDDAEVAEKADETTNKVDRDWSA